MHNESIAFWGRPKTDSDPENEDGDFHERLKSLIRVISGNHKLHVTTEVDPYSSYVMRSQGKDPDRTWFRYKKGNEEYVHIPKVLIEEEDEAMGIGAHEAGHVLITRMGEIVPEEVLKKEGFAAILSAIEERPTDLVVRKNFLGAKRWLEKARKKEASKGKIGSSDRSLSKEALFSQLCSLIVYEPYIESDSLVGLYPPEVLELYEKIRDHVIDIEHDIPEPGDPEDEVMEHSVSRYSKTYTNIYPEIQELLKKDHENKFLEEIIREMLSQLSSGLDNKGLENQSGDDSGTGGLNKTIEDIVNKHLSEQAQEKKEKLEELISKIEDHIANEENNDGLNDLLDELADIISDPGLSEEIKKEMKKSQDKPGDSTESSPSDPAENVVEQDQAEGQSGEDSEHLSNKDEKAEPDTGQSPSGEMPSDSDPSSGLSQESTENLNKDTLEKLMNKIKERQASEQQKDRGQMSEADLADLVQKKGEEIKDALKEKIDNLKAEDRSRLEEAASEKMKKIEDRLTEALRPSLTEETISTQDELNRDSKDGDVERLDKMTSDRSDERMLAPEQRKLLSVYEDAYKDIHEFDENLFQTLYDIFHPNKRDQVSYRRAGGKINLRRAIRREASLSAGSTPDDRIFERRVIPSEKDYALSLLVDLSGSMSDNGKIEKTLRGLIMLSEVLNRLGIDFEINGFQDEVISFKGIKESFTDVVRARVAGMVGEANGNNPGGHNWNDGNDDGPCLKEVADDFSKLRQEEKFIIVFSDGRPNGRRSNDEDLRLAINHIIKDTDVNLVGIGIGEGTEHVKSYYPVALPSIMLEDLSEELTELLRGIIENPEAFK